MASSSLLCCKVDSLDTFSFIHILSSAPLPASHSQRLVLVVCPCRGLTSNTVFPPLVRPLTIMRVLVGILLALCAHLAQAESRYVSENIYTYIHGGPGTQFRILGSIKAGEPVEVQGQGEGGFLQIVDTKGRSGWVKADDLQSTPSFRQREAEQQKTIDELKGRLQNLNGDNERLFAEKDETIKSQQQQLDSLKAQLKRQTDQIDTLKQQNEALNQGYDNREHDMQMDWFIRGGLMVAGGLVLGLLLPMLPRRRRKDRWMD